ncbi:MAG: SprT family zinc-dependent metalloprotease [Candidatus Margulisiibacteriota bacterium]|jgi:hypothetical protein
MTNESKKSQIITHKIVRSKRRTIALVIDGEANLIVRAPHSAPEEIIRKFILQKSDWIKAKQAFFRKRASNITQIIIDPQLIPEYKKKAGEIIPKRISAWSGITGWQPKKVRLSNAGSRWGSCNSKGTIAINWRLVFFSIEIIDYVVVHELAHLVERNHSKRFWEQVKVHIPDYKGRKKWLKENGHFSNSV